MAISDILTALRGAIDAVAPTTWAAIPFRSLDARESGSTQFEDRAQQVCRIYDLQPTGGMEDTGLMSGANLEEVQIPCLLHVGYPMSVAPEGEILCAILEDAVSLENALRPATVWSAYAADVTVYPTATLDRVQGMGGEVVSHILTLQIDIRWRP